MAKYLLPCSCGRKMPVEPRQAGQSVDCACGESLEIPTMLAMSALEPADSVAENPEPSAEELRILREQVDRERFYI